MPIDNAFAPARIHDYAVQIVNRPGTYVYAQQTCNLPDAQEIQEEFEHLKTINTHVRLVPSTDPSVADWNRRLIYHTQNHGLRNTIFSIDKIKSTLSELSAVGEINHDVQQYLTAAYEHLSIASIALTKLGECITQQ